MIPKTPEEIAKIRAAEAEVRRTQEEARKTFGLNLQQPPNFTDRYDSETPAEPNSPFEPRRR